VLDAVTVSEPSPGGVNFDFLLVSSRWAVVLDGVSTYPVDDVGCRHGGEWFVNRLGAYFGAALAIGSPDSSLQEVLATAISRTAADHPECDLTNPLTPAATVAAVRLRGAELDWLVLGDAAVAWMNRAGDADSVSDDRADHLANAPVVVADVRRYDPAFVAKIRNQPGGFWVAAADPAAAAEAVCGTLNATDLTRVGLFSDGITRLVDRYGWTWPQLFATVDTSGARALVSAVREAEQNDPDPGRWRGKPSDDASAVVARVVLAQQS